LFVVSIGVVSGPGSDPCPIAQIEYRKRCAKLDWIFPFVILPRKALLFS